MRDTRSWCVAVTPSPTLRLVRDEARRLSCDANVSWTRRAPVAWTGARVNHLPTVVALAAKRRLLRAPSMPDTYRLPHDRARWLADARGRPEGEWMYKRYDHRGVSVLRNATRLPASAVGVVQRRVASLRLRSRAFDLGLYALVHNGSAHVHRDVLLRFCRPGEDCVVADDYVPLWRVDAAAGAPREALRAWMREEHALDARVTLDRASAALRRTLAPLARDSRAHPRCAQLLRADHVVDPHGTPWLIEVNANPSLVPRCTGDEALKRGVVRWALHLWLPSFPRHGPMLA